MKSFLSQADNQAITRRVRRNPREMSHIPLSLCSLLSVQIAQFRKNFLCNAQGRQNHDRTESCREKDRGGSSQ